MLVNNLFIDYSNDVADPFWIEADSGIPVRVVEITDMNMTYRLKTIQEKKLPSNFFKVSDFEMDPNGSELILLPFKINFRDHEVMILQENSNGIMKVVTPLSEKLKQSYAQFDFDFDYPKFIQHPSVNLKLVSVPGIANIYQNVLMATDLHQPSGESIAEMFVSVPKMSAQDKKSALSNVDYGRQIKRHSTPVKKIEPIPRSVGDTEEEINGHLRVLAWLQSKGIYPQ